MRKIGVIPGTVIVATWVFVIGFAFGFESALASSAGLAADHVSATATGIMIGAIAVAVAGIAAFVVWLATRRRRATRLTPAR
ncbi:hypothetical protein [Agromyces neolithicus]|uniref:Uncharacterized protein n=1 Tax=Agromyces neolithicus TaxID=269420 RepID=A0ABN2M4A6_9MICO